VCEYKYNPKDDNVGIWSEFEFVSDFSLPSGGVQVTDESEECAPKAFE